MEYYSAMRKKEILTFMTTGMNLESIMLSKISHIKKNGLFNFKKLVKNDIDNNKLHY